MLRVELNRIEIVHVVFKKQTVFNAKITAEGIGGIPGLKNMYRIVAVFLCTLNGWPVRMTRFATILVVSGFMKEPIATSCGAVKETPLKLQVTPQPGPTKSRRTFNIRCLPQ
jgi:hypothetical protein